MALWFFKITDITGKLICFYVCSFRTLTMLLEQQCDFACISVWANLNTWSPPSMLGLFCQFVTARKNTVPLSAGFEPARGDPNGFLVHRLNHSATTTHVKPELILWDSAELLLCTPCVHSTWEIDTCQCTVAQHVWLMNSKELADTRISANPFLFTFLVTFILILSDIVSISWINKVLE